MLRYKCDTSKGDRVRPIISEYGNLKTGSGVTYASSAAPDGEVWTVAGCYVPSPK